MKRKEKKEGPDALERVNQAPISGEGARGSFVGERTSEEKKGKRVIGS